MTPRRVIQRKDGYRHVYMPEHPSASPRGYVYEHRLVAERWLGRPLRRDEIVHHLDDNPSNNAPENLVVTTKAHHQMHHLGKCGLSNEDIAGLIQEGWTYRQLAAVGVWQHRTRRIKLRLARRKCVYCSAPVTRGIACRGHRDLPNLDPHYSETA